VGAAEAIARVPADYLPFLEPWDVIPTILYRGLHDEDPTAADFLPYRLEEAGSQAPVTFVDELRWAYGISAWVSRGSLEARIIKNEESLRFVATLDITKMPWTRIGLLRKGPQFHFELLGSPDEIRRCVVGVAPIGVST
jgi:hypothetical protein